MVFAGTVWKSEKSEKIGKGIQFLCLYKSVHQDKSRIINKYKINKYFSVQIYFKYFPIIESLYYSCEVVFLNIR